VQRFATRRTVPALECAQRACRRRHRRRVRGESAGHGGAGVVKQQVEEWTEALAFMLNAVGH